MSLATPVERMAHEYDVVIVGSGYGGAVVASRLARAGRRVCILERGAERRPGDYPESAAEGVREIQLDWPDRRIGSPTALFDFRINPNISVLQGCGLGGTSLINANVAIRPDPRVWLDPVWPQALRADVETRLESGVRLALEMLQPVPFPEHLETPPKLRALEASAARMGARSRRLPITVNFRDGVNHVGVEQRACTSCGNCIAGCNVGAKNSLVMNYLPDARNHGAEIFTRTRVQRVERRGERWLVHFDLVEDGPTRFGAPGLFVAGDLVVLAAGSLGSTEILLRSRSAGLPLSERLGQGFTGNGDVLAFAYNADVPVRGVAVRSARARPGPGPCITAAIDLRDVERLEDGIIIEDGAIPSSLAPMLATSLFAAARAVGRDTDSGLRDYAHEKIREIQALAPGGAAGAVGHTQTFLAMAHDDSAGRIHLENDRIRISWPHVGKQAAFERIEKELLRATEALGGTYIKNPVWADRLGKSLITVHPLGGCGMGESAELGVVDHSGRVFAGVAGDEVHEGLYICDGSVMPRSLGANPLLTIAGLAERTCALIAEDRGWTIPYQLPSRPHVASGERKIGIHFTERMRGFFSLDSDLDFETGRDSGEESGSRFEFTVTIVLDDLEVMLRSPDHRAQLYGTVMATALSPEPLTVTGGTFELLTRDSQHARARRMTYRMPLVSRDGTRYHFHGFKHIEHDEGFDLWSDTTTLYVTVYGGENEAAPVVGRGILKIHPRDFARQLRTFTVTGASSLARRLKAASDFGRFFAGALYETHGGLPAGRRARSVRDRSE